MTFFTVLFALLFGLLAGVVVGVVLFAWAMLHDANARDYVEKEAIDSRIMIEVRESEEL